MEQTTPPLTGPDLLELRQQLFQRAEEIGHLGIWYLDLQTRYYFISDNLYRLLGMPTDRPDVRLGEMSHCVHTDDLERVRTAHRALLEAPQPTTIEFRFIRPDNGAVRHLRLRADSFVTTDGRQFVSGVTQDITEEVTLREQLAERTRFAEMLVDTNADWIMAFDLDYRITAWNTTCEQVYGIAREQVLGRPALEVFPKFGQRADLNDAVLRAYGGERVHVPATTGVYTPRYAEFYFVPLRDVRQAVVGVLVVGHDITPRIRSEQALDQKNRELERINGELASFAYVASHDLSEPLRKIRSFSDRILRREAENLSEQSRDEFGRIQSAIERMGALIDDLLAFSRLSTGDQSRAAVDLNQVLETVRQDLHVALSRTGATVEADPLPIIAGNRTQLYQLLLNLLSNAIKFQPDGQRPHVEIRCAELPAGQHPPGLSPTVRLARIDVRDNGIGFEPEFADRIFQMFQRLHGKHEYGGTGIGLAICKKIAENHGGKIEAHSELGKGATFSVWLPLGE